MTRRRGPVRVLELRSVRGTGGGPEKTILMGAALRAAVMLRRRMRPTIFGAAQALAVAIVFDAARALALLARGSHQTRRTA